MRRFTEILEQARVIDGYLGQVQPDQVIGWAYDRTSPDAHVVVDVYCGSRYLGSTEANIFRADLASGQVGQGDHGFSFRFPAALESGELAAVVARVRTLSAPEPGHELPRYSADERSSVARAAAGVPKSVYHDDTQFPVFVLGAPRSGTSAVAQAVMAATPYQGHQEGHVIDLLTPILSSLRRFYESKTDDILVPERITMIKKIPEEYFTDGIGKLFADAVRPLFPDSHWCDKTPTPEMIWAAPHVMRIWPNAKFIFVKRRALENLMSRIRKFPSFPFEAHCLYWAACMEAWRAVRGELAGRALELDQYFVARQPARATQAIGALLALAPAEVAELERVLSRHQPERTGGTIRDIYDAATLDWDAAQWATFDRVCGPTMDSYGYSRDGAYFVASGGDESCRAL